MKNRLLFIVMAFALLLSLVACGGDTSEQGPTDTENSANTEKPAENSAKGVDASLEGTQLISSLSGDRPETLKIESEMTAFGMTTKLSTYYKGDKIRTETDIEGMPKSVLIHLPGEDVMYQYMYGKNEGIKINGGDASCAEEMGLMLDSADLFAQIKAAGSKDLVARVENLDGEEVVYVEATQSDEEMEEVLVKMWYSVKYGTLLKYQVIAGQEPLMEIQVTKVYDNINMDESLFQPPSDVTFTEMDMEALMSVG